MASQRIGLSTFIISGVVATAALVTGRISTPVYVAVIGFSWLLGKTIASWNNPGELKISLWEDLGIVWKIRERATFVAAKAKEVERIECELRELLGTFLEAWYLSLGTRNIFPIPPAVATVINERINHLLGAAVLNPVQRAGLVARCNDLIQQAQQNPRSE